MGTGAALVGAAAQLALPARRGGRPRARRRGGRARGVRAHRPLARRLTRSARAAARRRSPGPSRAAAARTAVRSRPTATAAHSSASQVADGEHDVDPDHARRQLHRVLRGAHEALAGEQHADRRHRVARHVVRLARAQQEPASRPRRGRAASRGSRAGGSPSRACRRPASRAAGTMSPVPSPPACGPAAVAIVPSGERDRAEHHQAAHRPDAEPVARAPRPRPARAPRARRATTQATSSSIESRKCPITQPGLSPYQTVMPPSTAWQRTPSGSSSAISARSRRNGRRNQARIAAARQGRPDDAGEQPVAELDERVRRELGREPRPLAARPVRAAEPGAGEPHRGAGEDDQRADDERRDGDPEVRARRDGEKRGATDDVILTAPAAADTRLDCRRRAPAHTARVTRRAGGEREAIRA